MDVQRQMEEEMVEEYKKVGLYCSCTAGVPQVYSSSGGMATAVCGEVGNGRWRRWWKNAQRYYRCFTDPPYMPFLLP